MIPRKNEMDVMVWVDLFLSEMAILSYGFTWSKNKTDNLEDKRAIHTYSTKMQSIKQIPEWHTAWINIFNFFIAFI